MPAAATWTLAAWLVTGVVFGLGYGLIYPRLTCSPGAALTRGMTYGFVWCVGVALTRASGRRGGPGVVAQCGSRRVRRLSRLPAAGGGVGLLYRWLDALRRLLFEQDERTLERERRRARAARAGTRRAGRPARRPRLHGRDDPDRLPADRGGARRLDVGLGGPRRPPRDRGRDRRVLRAALSPPELRHGVGARVGRRVRTSVVAARPAHIAPRAARGRAAVDARRRLGHLPEPHRPPRLWGRARHRLLPPRGALQPGG